MREEREKGEGRGLQWREVAPSGEQARRRRRERRGGGGRWRGGREAMEEERERRAAWREARLKGRKAASLALEDSTTWTQAKKKQKKLSWSSYNNMCAFCRVCMSLIGHMHVECVLHD